MDKRIGQIQHVCSCLSEARYTAARFKAISPEDLEIIKNLRYRLADVSTAIEKMLEFYHSKEEGD